MPELIAGDLSISFPGLSAPVLSVESLTVPAGGRVVVTGASGSGKSTLINLVSGLTRPDQGVIRWGGEDIARLGETARDRWRASNVGLVMQDFHLFPGLSAVENILLPARLARAAGADARRRALELLARVGLKRPEQSIETMSRGEMQRVAVARALLRKPGVLVADEPTASLDVEAGEVVGRLLLDLAEEEGATLIVVSHDTRMIARLPRRLNLSGGRIVEDVVSGTEART